MSVVGGHSNKCTMFRRDENFPFKLYRMLEEAHRVGLTNIVSWSHDGRSVIIHQPKIFEKTFMVTFFEQTKYKR